MARPRDASARRRRRPMTAIRVVLAEDQPMVRAGFRSLLDSRDDFEVVGEAATGSEALEQARAQRPDVVVMEIRLPDMDGLEATLRNTSDPALAADGNLA